MAIDLRHGIYIRKGGANTFFGSYSHSVSPALAFRVSGVTRYVPLETGGSTALKVRKSGTVYNAKKVSLQLDLISSYNATRQTWGGIAVLVKDFSSTNCLSENIIVKGQLRNSSGGVLATKTVTLTAGTETASDTNPVTVSRTTYPNNVLFTFTGFGRTWTYTFTNVTQTFNIQSVILS